MVAAVTSPFGRERLAKKRASLAEAYSSWSNLKKALQVNNTLEESEGRYVDADPLWINEGKTAICHAR